MKEWSRRLQAAEDKQLLPSERYRGIDNEVHAVKARRDELDAHHDKAHVNMNLMTAKRSSVDLHNKLVYLASDLPEQAGIQMRTVCTKHSMEVTCRMDAHFLGLGCPPCSSEQNATIQQLCISSSFMVGPYTSNSDGSNGIQR